MPKVDPNYRPLRVAFDGDGKIRDERERRVVERAVKRWLWKDPIRAKRLPPLIELIEDQAAAEVLITWHTTLGMTDHEEYDETLGRRVTRPAPVLGETDTARDGSRPCLVRLSREIFKEMPLNPVWAVTHELGHAMGLGHQPGGVMVDRAGRHYTGIDYMDRERAASNRLEGVVGYLGDDR